MSMMQQGLMCRLGTAFEGKYSNSISQAYVYPSSNFLDDLAFGAAWMYRKTGEAHFLDVSAPTLLPLPNKSTWPALCKDWQVLCACRVYDEHLMVDWIGPRLDALLGIA